MTTVTPFKGSTLCANTTWLGEGPSYDPATDTLWWLNILGKELHALQLESGTKTVHPLPMMASVIARIDNERQMLATENGLYIRDMESGDLSKLAGIEDDRPDTRSNDGRVHPSGSLWIGTMGKQAENGAGAIYHVAGTRVTKIVASISIPNGICFSPDGRTGYYVDSKVNHTMAVDLDPETGLPMGPARLFADSSHEAGVADGAVVDRHGTLWNARWGAGEVHTYTPDGTRTGRYAVPMRQVTCPAFIGRNANGLALTSAWEHMDEAARARDPAAGTTLNLGIAVEGRFEPHFKL